MTHYIYKITNILDNKVYIGQTIQPNKRWYKHKSFAKNPEKTNQYIHRAMNAHGVENFTFEIIATCDNQTQADQLETELVEKYQSRDKQFGYNLKPGGYVRGVWKHSPETKQKLSEQWHQDHPPESVAKTAAANLGSKKPHSEETKKKIGAANAVSLKGKQQAPEMIAKRIASMAEKYGDKTCNAPGCERTDGCKFKGVRYCELHVQRMRAYGSLELPTHKRIMPPRSSETIAKQAASLRGKMVGEKNPFYGKQHTPEVMEKLRQLNLGKEPPNKMKFSEEQINKILTDPRGLRKIAKDFNVSITVIKRIKKEKLCLD